MGDGACCRNSFSLVIIPIILYSVGCFKGTRIDGIDLRVDMVKEGGGDTRVERAKSSEPRRQQVGQGVKEDRQSSRCRSEEAKPLGRNQNLGFNLHFVRPEIGTPLVTRLDLTFPSLPIGIQRHKVLSRYRSCPPHQRPWFVLPT